MILTLSLVMCLTMAFPASAADYPVISSPYYMATYNYIEDKANNYGYPYKAYFICPSTNILIAICSKTPNLIDRDAIRLFGRYVDKGGSTWTTTGAGDDYFKSIVVNSKIILTLYTNSTFNATRAGTTLEYYLPEMSTLKLNIPASLCRSLSEFVPPVDTSALQTLITQAKAMQNTGYTSESWNALQAQITASESVIANASKTQAQVDSAKNALQAALDNLALSPPLPDTIELDELLVEADVIEDIGYTVNSWVRFDNARIAGHALLARPTYTETEVHVTTVELRTSMNALAVAQPVEPPKPPATPLGYDLETGDVSGYLKVVPGIFYNYIRSAQPIAIGIFGIVLSILIVPRVLVVIIPKLRR